jgi:hypothetical protein
MTDATDSRVINLRPRAVRTLAAERPSLTDGDAGDASPSHRVGCDSFHDRPHHCVRSTW